MAAQIRSRSMSPRRSSWRSWQLAGLTALSGYSTGVGWQAQIVSYPFFATISAEAFAAYHQQYNRAIPTVVVAPGFLTFLTSAAFPWTRPSGVSRRLAAVVAVTGGLGGLLSTVAWAIPMHDRLDRIGQDRATIENLLRANLVRSLLLTASTLALVAACRQQVRHGDGPGPAIPKAAREIKTAPR